MTWEIIHGDCLEVMRGFEPGQFDAVVTDPPYGVGATPPRGGKKEGTLLTDAVDLPWDVFDLSWLGLWSGVAAVFCDAAHVGQLWSAMKADGMLAYVKSNPHPMGSSFEPCVTRGVPGAARHFVAYNAENGQEHPTQKPLSLMRWVVERTTKPGDTILDPFCGSGTTGVACIQTGRHFVGIELNAEYCRVARERCAAAERQGDLFVAAPQPKPKADQGKLF